MNRGYLPALTGFRAVAALLVFLFHYRTATGWLPAGLEVAWRFACLDVWMRSEYPL